MTGRQMHVLVLLGFGLVLVQGISGNQEDNEKWNKRKLGEHPEQQQDWNEALKQHHREVKVAAFDCEIPPSGPEPTSVHELRPGDIDVIAAIGDSVTAGNGIGAETVGEVVANMNRGESWSIGVNGTISTVFTVANILREYNPELVGGSYNRPGIGGNGSSCSATMECAGLNVAVPGATNRGVPGQARDLVEKIHAHPDINIDNDWKLVTLLIGGNDLCRVCINPDTNGPQAYFDSVKEAIDIVKASVPRVLFQVVTMFDVTPLKNMSTGPECDVVQESACPCAIHNDSTREVLRQTQMEYWRLLDELINIDATYDGDNSFTVVNQHHMRELTPPLTEDGEWDKSFLAPDCFHPNRKGHQEMALQLWNTMLTPVPEKPFSYPFADQEAKCPTEEAPYIYTNDNSKTKIKETVDKKDPALQNDHDDTSWWNEKMEKFETWLEKHPKEKQNWLKAWKRQREEDTKLQVPGFGCDVTPSGQEPTSVHNLRPGDIDVIGAFGDSITAGNGIDADTVGEVGDMNRGESWSIGVNGTVSSVFTIANILREYNSELVGGSYNRPGVGGNGSSCSGTLECAQLNVAVPGATNRGIPNQAEDLVQKMIDHPNVDMAEHWKLVTLLIGGNDLCRVCFNPDTNGPQAYFDSVKEAIDIVKASVPRVLFQVVTMFDITPLKNMSTGPACDAIHENICNCAVHNDTTREILRQTQREYWRLLDELINVDGAYDGDDTFTVVLQPHMRDAEAPVTEDGEWDRSFFAPDCFHPNRKGHQAMAVQLWNTMLTPVQEKPFFYPIGVNDDAVCPTEEAPYIFTNDNSRTIKKAPVPQNDDDTSWWNEKMEKFQTWLEEHPEEKQNWLKAWKRQRQEDTKLQVPGFGCDVTPSGQEPTSVHNLRPGDIDVIGAFGDSITAGNGIDADTVGEVGDMNRGESWSIGVNGTVSSVFTIANILREYNSELVGGSYNRPGVGGNGSSCSGTLECAQLNVAVPGATNRGIPNQAEDLVQKMIDHPNVDMAEHWKLVTLLIGGNDLCRVCFNPDTNGPQAYFDSVKEAIDIVKASVPRVLFQVVTMFDITPLKNMSTGPACDAIHENICNCAVHNDTTREILRQTQREYWRLLDELINIDGAYDGDDTFTVVLQPHMRDAEAPVTEDGEWDRSFFAPDCFHPNRKGHHAMAVQLWNTMLTPVQEKPFFYPIGVNDDAVCPTEEAPYIFTNDNSRTMKKGTDAKWDSDWQKTVDKLEQWLEEHPEQEDKWYTDWEKQSERDRSLEVPVFNCNIPPPLDEPPTSVHQLRPSDIKVIAALGDSITSGNGVGAEGIPGVAVENRGESWCIGVNGTVENIATIANVLKEFNPGLVGGSYSRPIEDGNRNRTHCSEIMQCAQLNVAVPGATNRHMPEQAEDLISKIRSHPAIDVENDWKLVTLLIGGNDLCGACRREDNAPPPYVENIKIAIDNIKANIPRVLFQVVAMFDVTPLGNFSTGLACDIAQMGFCECALYNDSTIEFLRQTKHGYWRLLDELININGTYNGDDSFTVVLQPHMRDLIPPVTEDGEWDNSVLSPDCFHPNRKGHMLMAYQLWNMMLTPVQNKPFQYPGEDQKVFKCPTQEAPFIFTNENSQQTNKVDVQVTKPLSGAELYHKNLRQFNEWLDAHPDLKEAWLEEWEEGDNSALEYPAFNCSDPGPGDPPTSVHALRPGDIDVVASFGDSVTAGNGLGADTLPGVAIENRGEVWCAGGNGSIETVLTVPNLLKEFNPDLKGWSYSRPGIGGDRNKTYCGRDMVCAQLNLADPGGTSRDMPTQALEIIERMQEDYIDVDIVNDWKLITLFIGGNDLCAVCRRWDDYNPVAYTNNIKTAIDSLKASLPRTIVQIVTMFDVSPLSNMSTGLVCDTMHRQFCDCAVHNDTVRSILRPVQMEYWRLLDELINVNATYDGDDSFTVVLQPHMRDLVPPVIDGEWDTSYFSPDCFHPNRKGHQSMAYQLWNMMLTPVPQKPFLYPSEDQKAFKCPTQEAPYIFTNDNSRSNAQRRDGVVSGVSQTRREQLLAIVEEERLAFEDKWEEVMSQIEESNHGNWDTPDTTDDEDLIIPPFECDVNVLPQEPATNVHELKVSDIQVVAAFGDSITAGNGLGAEFLPGVAIENRGESWSVGGNQSILTILTVPNLIKEYNADLTGWSWSREGRLDRNDTHCDENWECSQLNVASPGATNRGMGGQAIGLVEKMQAEEDIDFENDWKLLTMFIGGNDLCRVCENEESYGPEAYRDGIQEALDHLYTTLPRALVNLVIMFDVSPLTNMSTGISCDLLHIGFCACAVNEDSRATLRGIQLEYYNLLNEMVESGRYDDRDDFTVVIQPHQRDIGPVLDEDGNIDHSYFSPDCFHPSRKGHHGFAYMLWNVMLMPVGQKPFEYDAYEEQVFRCPSEEYPYIFTNQNSDVDWEPTASLTLGRLKKESVVHDDKQDGAQNKPSVGGTEQKPQDKPRKVLPNIQPELFEAVNELAGDKPQPVQYSDHDESASTNDNTRMQYVYGLLGAIGGLVCITLVIAALVPYIKKKNQDRKAKRHYSGIQEYPNLVFEADDEEA